LKPAPPAAALRYQNWKFQSRGAVAPASAEGVDDFAIGCEREPLELDGRASDIPTQPLEPVTIVFRDANLGLQAETEMATFVGELERSSAQGPSSR